MTAVSIKEVSTAVYDAIVADAALDAFRKSIRGDGSAGVTERRVYPPAVNNDRFQVPGSDSPYICVCGIDGELLAHTGDGRRSPAGWSRRIIGVLSLQEPTYESDAQIKELFELTMRVLLGDTLSSSLQAIGMRQVLVQRTLVDGINAGDQPMFGIDFDAMFQGEAML